MHCYAAAPRCRSANRWQEPAVRRGSMLQSVSNGGGASREAQVRVLEGRNNPEVDVLCSKRLPQSDEDLCCFDARYRFQVVADIDADRADRSVVSQAQA